MGDNEASHVRSPEPISITILRARDVRGVKGDVVGATVKAEFGEKVLGESPKVECSPETPAEFNYTVSMNCTFEDSTFLDEIAYKPFVLTITEILPKEKKQKEEKTQILGQCSFDLLPLVKGALKHKYTLTVHPVPGSPLEQSSLDGPKPEIDVQLSVENALVGEAMQQDSNIMTITVESLFSPPDAFTLNGPNGVYTAVLPVPFSSERETPVVFAGGLIKPSVDKEPAIKNKKWMLTGTAQGNAVYIPDSVIASDPIDNEDGDFRAKDDREHRQLSETEKNRITWNIERRCFMQASSLKAFQDKIAKTRVWPVEVFRLAAGSGGKGKKEDDSLIGFHGVAYVNFSPLLYPGVKRLRGAFKIYPYIENDFCDKTKRKSGMGEEAARIANGIMNRGSVSPFGKKGDKDAKGKAAEKKDAEVLVMKLKTDEVPPGDRPFHDLDQESPASSVDNVSNGQGAAGSISGRSQSISLSSKNSTKKDRPAKFLRGLFNGSISGSPSGTPGRNKVSLRSTRRSRRRPSKGSQDFDEITSPKPDIKQLEKQVVDVETAIALAEKQKAALEKLILMQEQNQKTCDMDQVKAEMTQIESHLTNLNARLARGETHYDMNESEGRNSGSTSHGIQAAADENLTDDDDDYEFGPRESSHQSDQASDKNSYHLPGAVEDETSTDREANVAAPPQQFTQEVPKQFVDSRHYEAPSQQQTPLQSEPQGQEQPEATHQEREQQYIEIQNEHYPCIGSAVSLYPFVDNDDPTMLNIQAQEQFYVLHRDDDWTYVTRIDGSAKGMVPTTYLRIFMY